MSIPNRPAPYPAYDGTQPCLIAPNAFFPNDGDKGINAALDTCKTRCKFRQRCLAYALTHDVVGIWGGTTTKERERIRKERKIAAVPIVESEERKRIEQVRVLRAAGLSIAETAVRLGVTPRTVERDRTKVAQ